MTLYAGVSGFSKQHTEEHLENLTNFFNEEKIKTQLDLKAFKIIIVATEGLGIKIDYLVL